MQQRVPIKHFTEFKDASEAKEKIQIANPTVTYAVRRYHNGFNLVRRYPVNQIKQHEEHYQKKRTGPGKRKRKGQIDGAFLREVRGSNQN